MVSSDGSTITVTTPPGSVGATNVVVTTAGGTATGPDFFTYVTPVPSVLLVTPAQGLTLGNNSVTISGANFTGATAVTFGGSPATGVIVTNDGFDHGDCAGACGGCRGCGGNDLRRHRYRNRLSTLMLRRRSRP